MAIPPVYASLDPISSRLRLVAYALSRIPSMSPHALSRSHAVCHAHFDSGDASALSAPCDPLPISNDRKRSCARNRRQVETCRKSHPSINTPERTMLFVRYSTQVRLSLSAQEPLSRDVAVELLLSRYSAKALARAKRGD
jgi:hypothetical protein